ncbi:MAG: hypothetical protein HFE39_01490 [Clostridiales bacterium]|jgi:hypothetical protein|nr:hypothetical protein [Clostridiales bacterium]
MTLQEIARHALFLWENRRRRGEGNIIAPGGGKVREGAYTRVAALGKCRMPKSWTLKIRNRKRFRNHQAEDVYLLVRRARICAAPGSAVKIRETDLLHFKAFGKKKQPNDRRVNN